MSCVAKAWPVVLLLLLAAPVPLGCGRGTPPVESEPDSVRDRIERGPLRLTVEARPAPLTFGDVLTVEIELQLPPDASAELPDETALRAAIRAEAESSASSAPAGAAPPVVADDWLVRGVLTPPEQQLADGTRVLRRSLELEAARSGNLVVPGLSVRYGEKQPMGASPASLEHELASRPLAVTVRSVLTDQDSPGQPRDITAVRTPAPLPLDARLWAALALAAVALLVLAWFLVRRWRARVRRPPPPLPPEVWAEQALAGLVARVYFDSGRVREYYYALNEIVRIYIERRFDVAAPEMTTEEFLRTLERRERALPFDGRELAPFLEACDLVKYAAYAPRCEDAERAAETAVRFVRTTSAAWAAQQATTGAPATTGAAA